MSTHTRAFRGARLVDLPSLRPVNPTLLSPAAAVTQTHKHTRCTTTLLLKLTETLEDCGKVSLPASTPPLLRMSAPPSSGLRNEGEGGGRVLLWATPAPLTDRAEVNHSDNCSTHRCHRRVWGNG